MKDSITELVKHARVRNRLLMAQTLQTELREAARRVVRLSQPGTPERLLTLMAVADDTGLSIGDISEALANAAPEGPS